MKPVQHRLLLIAAAVVLATAAGCAKKKVATQPPPAPPPQTAAAPSRATTPPAARPRPSTPNTASAAPQARVPNAATRARIDQLLARIEDAYFDYNKHNLRPDAINALQADSTELRDIIVQYPDYKLTIEGHCDERGSEEYNRALGDARAHSARDYLASVGIPGDQLAVISYGKDKPVCEDHDETCWQKNRRVHIVAAMR